MKRGPTPTVENHPIKRAAQALYPGRSFRSLSDEEFWDCVRVARAWLMRAGEWCRTTCRQGHELDSGTKVCMICETEREARYRATARERAVGRPPRKTRETKQRGRRARAA